MLLDGWWAYRCSDPCRNVNNLRGCLSVVLLFVFDVHATKAVDGRIATVKILGASDFDPSHGIQTRGVLIIVLRTRESCVQ